LSGLGTVSALQERPAESFDVLVNASLAGMQGFSPFPWALESLLPLRFVGCAVTNPAMTPLIAAAKATGCTTVTGTEMYAALEGLMLHFLRGRDAG
jgi:shikimate dehydrogenase